MFTHSLTPVKMVQIEEESLSLPINNVLNDKQKKKKKINRGRKKNKCPKQEENNAEVSDNKLTTKEKCLPSKKQSTITNYFPVISRRMLAAKKKEEEYQKNIVNCIENKTDPKEYLSVTQLKDKGQAIIARLLIRKGSFICEYSGDLIDLETAKKREKSYENCKAGCYMYYFNWNSTNWCIDATKPTGRYGRLINHSRKSPNCKTIIFEHKQIPHLIFIALKDIQPNEEILYDYGERDPNAIRSNPWLTKS